MHGSVQVRLQGPTTLATLWTDEPRPGADLNKPSFTIMLVSVIPLFWFAFVSNNDLEHLGVPEKEAEVFNKSTVMRDISRR